MVDLGNVSSSVWAKGAGESRIETFPNSKGGFLRRKRTKKGSDSA